jgi:choline dehydrogenase-like flavoprotein
VILSAGAVGSPRILQLSGVGAPEHLGRVGIGVHQDLPGSAGPAGPLDRPHQLCRPRCGDGSTGARALAAEVLRYLVTGKGILTYSASLDAATDVRGMKDEVAVIVGEMKAQFADLRNDPVAAIRLALPPQPEDINLGHVQRDPKFGSNRLSAPDASGVGALDRS